MFRRLRRPGYWIVLLIILTVYFYRQYLEREEQERREALFRLYQSYGSEILGQLGDQNLTAIHEQLLAARQRGEISLEDIALFVTTLHLDRKTRAHWSGWEEQEGNVTLHGDLLIEENTSYPMDLMAVRRGERLLLHRLRVGPRTLELKAGGGFPFGIETEKDKNSTWPISEEQSLNHWKGRPKD